MRQITILQVDRCANQLSRTNFFGFRVYGGKDRFRLYPEERRFEIWQPRRFCGFDWRVGAYPSARLAHASARRMGTDRSGAWGVGCGFWRRLQRERRVCWSVAVFKFCLGSVSGQNSEMSVGDGASTSREYMKNQIGKFVEIHVFVDISLYK